MGKAPNKPQQVAAPEAEQQVAAPEVVEAGTKRAAAAANGVTEADRMIAALQEERRGYVQRGQNERATQVDAQIALWQKRK